MCVFKKANEVVKRDFNGKLSSWTRGGLQNKALGWYVYIMYFTDFLRARDPANLQIKYRINWSCFPFYVQLENDILLIKNIISNSRDIFRWNTRMDRVSINKICSMSVWQPFNIHRCVQNVGFSRRKVQYCGLARPFASRPDFCYNKCGL